MCTLNLCQAMSTLDRAKASDNNDADITIEQSYDISPYKGSDDDEEDADESEPNRKFVPPWARYVTQFNHSRNKY